MIRQSGIFEIAEREVRGALEIRGGGDGTTEVGGATTGE
jgi:hypothetical protein